MADNKHGADKAEGESEKVEKRPLLAGQKALIAIIGGGVLVVVLSIVGTLALLGVFDSGEGEAEEEIADAGAEHSEKVEKDDHDEADGEGDQKAIYYAMKPPLVVNFQVASRQRLLQVDISIVTHDSDVIKAIDAHLPLIRNKLNMLYGSEVFDDLLTVEGRDALRKKTLAAIQEILKKEIGKSGVDQVFFTNFVMQ